MKKFHVIEWLNSSGLKVIRPKATLARAQERVHIRQNVRDFSQTKLDSEINSPFLSNEHGDPRFFFRYLLRIV